MINIVGSGLAGLSAAIRLAQKGIRCNIISVQEAQRAQSVMAEGGINAALNTMNENDDVSLHYEDTIRGGGYLANPNSVNNLVNHAPEIVNWLLKLGVPFEMKNGKIIQRNFGGQKNKRTAYVKSSTGKMLMSALIDEARKYEDKGMIYVYSHHRVNDIIIEDGVCQGLKMCDLYTNKYYRLSGKVILACGGLTGFFPHRTTGSTDNTGQLVANLFAKGLKMANLEMIQYHPTTINITDKRLLISEAARGEGARFMTYRNAEPYYFMEEMYPVEKNLTTRDVATRAIVKILNDPECSGQVYLDMRHLDKNIWKTKLSDMHAEVMDYLNIDLSKHPLPIEPGIHYFMGGVKVDEKHQTSILNLYAAGECACQYHGANRLGGNSLLGAIYGGLTAADNIVNGENVSLIETDGRNYETSSIFNENLASILYDGLSIIRDEKTITDAINKVNILVNSDFNKYEHNKALLAKAMLMCALNRKESRGAHYRSDYPETNDEYRKTTVAYYDNEIKIEYESIPERRLG